MADRTLVVDANILISGVLGKRVKEIIARYSAEVVLLAPDVAFADTEEHLREFAAAGHLPLDEAMETYKKLCAHVGRVPAPGYADYEADARARIERVDPDDWPVIASALMLDCPIWTEDRDFFGVGVPTWTTDRVELFFTRPEPQIAKVEQTNEGSGNE